MWLVDLKKLAQWYMQKPLNKGRNMQMVWAATFPLRQLYNRFTNFRKETLYYLSHNSQVCYLRKVCNDKCDTQLRRIYITDFNGIQGVFAWPDEDVRDIDVTNDIYLWPDNMYADSGIDFTVHVPASVVDTDTKLNFLKSQINTYKLPGKNYNIETF